jgi:predicted SAM-dependent methyltransferase
LVSVKFPIPIAGYFPQHFLQSRLTFSQNSEEWCEADSVDPVVDVVSRASSVNSFRHESVIFITCSEEHLNQSLSTAKFPYDFHILLLECFHRISA